VHLSRAFQIVEGEVPLRDFFDPGLFLQYYASAAALVWSGHNLFGEGLLTAGLLTAGFIARGSVLTFLAARWLSRSYSIAFVATMVGILAMPRLYSYGRVPFPIRPRRVYQRLGRRDVDLKPTGTYDLFDLPCYR
jgi:hypothetical protein